MSEAALMIIDMQNDYCDVEGAIARRGEKSAMIEPMVPRLRALLEAARNQNIEVIFVKTIHEPCTNSKTWLSRLSHHKEQVCAKDSWGSEYYALSPLEGETEVIKHRYSAFIHTRLDTILRSKQIDTLYMTGVSTNVCVESTARDGFMLDYEIVLVDDCAAAFTQKEHDMTLENMNKYFGAVENSDKVIKQWTLSTEHVGA